jgi:hypothetical protein
VKPSNEKLNCSIGFKQVDSNCIPICQQWSAYSHTEVKLSNILTIFAASIAVLTGITVLVVGYIRRNKM